MIIYLLRHGEAEDVGPGGARTDAERRLTENGKERLRRAAPTWRRAVESLDAIYVSPLVRARETAVYLADAARCPEPAQVREFLTPESDPAAAVRLILADATAGRSAIALVGHEPHLGDLLGELLGAHGAVPFKKGMLVGVELEGVAAAVSRLVLCLSSKLASRLDC